MQIVLGLEFDSGAFPDELESVPATCGRAVLGPLGLIDVLETRLGLSGRSVRQAVRIGQYLRCLRALDDGSRFYSKSFAADAWSTAREILGWRDELRIAGWSSKAAPGMSLRLDTLLEIESASPELSPGLGDRIWSILEVPPAGKPIDIESIELAEPGSLWPYPWGRVFNLLERLGVRVAPVAHCRPACAGELTDLEVLCRSVLSNTCSERPPSGDGSIMALCADTREQAAEGLACWLAADKEANPDVVIIRGDGSRILDDRLQRLGLPRLGTRSQSRWRAAVQVLSLALSSSWTPFDPYRLLEFLSLPKSPIQKGLAVFFESALREHPGIGGPKWEEAWQKAREKTAKWLEEEGLAGAAFRKKLQKSEADLKFWLEENRFDRSAGIPAANIIEICRRVKEWAARRGGMEDDSLLLTAAIFAGLVADAVAATGLSRISKPQLDRIMDSVVGEGAEDPQDYAEASAWSSVITPGQIWKPAKTIVWWDCIVSDHPGFHTPWTRAEREALAGAGVFLENSATGRLREAKAWQRPAVMATDRLLLVMPAPPGSDRVRPHPVWEEVQYRLGCHRDGSTAQGLIFSAGSLLERPQRELCGRILRREKIGPDPLPEAGGTWHVPAGRSWARPVESYSSLSLLIQCPFSWVLTYGMNLRAGPLMSLPEGPQLMGLLSHGVVESLLRESRQWKPAAAKVRAKEIFDHLAPQMAASLLQPGKELELSRRRETVGRAVERLFELSREANLEVVGFEQTYAKPLLSGQVFEGRLDLLLKSTEGTKVVWDLKWSERSRYRKEELQGGRALQLAAYAWLVSEGASFDVPAGYFMLSQGELFSVSCAGLPDYCQFQDVDLPSVWEMGLRAYEQRIEELRAGAVSASGLLSEEEVETPCRWCDFTPLCGWRADPDG